MAYRSFGGPGRLESPASIRRLSQAVVTQIPSQLGLCHGLVEVGNEPLDLGSQVLFGVEVAAANEFSDQYREPDHDLIEPGGVARREVEGDPMLWLREECLPSGSVGEHAGLAFDAEGTLHATGARNQTNDGLRQVDVEIVADEIPFGVGAVAAQHASQKACEVLLGPAVANDS